MSNLIERLRNGTDAPSIDYYSDWHRWADNITDEAADEIEKLRADLDRSMRAYEYVCIERENKVKEIERLQRENEMLEELTDRQSKHISDLAHENEELREACDEFYATFHKYYSGTINELVEEWQALKAQSTEPVAWTNTYQLAYLKDTGIHEYVPMSMWKEPFDSEYVPLYLHPPKQESAEPVGIEDFKQHLSDLRKAAYEFGLSNNQDDHDRMMAAQRACFEYVESLHPKQESTEQPVAWEYRTYNSEKDEVYYHVTQSWLEAKNYDQFPAPLYYTTTPPTATALVDDFKRRAIEVMAKHEDVDWDLAMREIESLPLIGEKHE